jgi:hypothetical protein
VFLLFGISFIPLFQRQGLPWAYLDTEATAITILRPSLEMSLAIIVEGIVEANPKTKGTIIATVAR